ncbi:MAG: hypothetical protein J5526_07735 [Bacteroidales bacterium]|nr:hypothetical protein [Bacteroidales bacterium]
MKRNIFISLIICTAIVFSSCHHETELEKIVRHANKRCPVTITDGMRLDSIVVSGQVRARTGQLESPVVVYYVTLFGIYEEEWMKDVVEANLEGLDNRQVSALLAQGLKDDPQFERILKQSDCDLSLVLQYADGRQVKCFDIDPEADATDGNSATMDIIRRDVQNSNAACPMEIAQGITMQSVTLDDEETAVTYVFRIGGEGITPESVDRSLLEGLQASISADLETNPAMRIYRDNGISIKYIFENIKGEELYGFEF